MRKAMMIMILAAMISGCANNVKEEKQVTSSATTTTATTTKAVQTTAPLTTQSRYTTTAEASKTAVSAVSVMPETTTAKSITTQNRHTYVVYETEYAEVEQPEQTAQTEQIAMTTTTAATTTTSPSVTASATTSGTHTTVEWNENMAVWRKLCEGRQLTESEQNVIRSEIQDYALTIFNGRQNIHVCFGTDEFDISFESPLELVVRNKMVGMENAHMDAYVDPNRKAMIDYASSEKEIYTIVTDTRNQCLHLIDYGLFNRWEIFTINNALRPYRVSSKRRSNAPAK